MPEEETILDSLAAIMRAHDVRGVSDFFDADNCPYELLPHLAWLVGAKVYTEILGEDYARSTVKNATLYNELTGTGGVLRRFADAVGITYSLQPVRSGNPQRIVRFIVTVSSVTRDGINFAEYLVRSIKALLPVTLAEVQGNTVQLAVSLPGELRFNGTMTAASFIEIKGGASA